MVDEATVMELVKEHTKSMESKVPAKWAEQKEKFKKMKQSTAKQIAHMVQEFEIRKAADVAKRILEAKSGQLNISKLAEYKLVDDMFKKFNIVPQGENHGVIIMVDWSGSMTKKWNNTITQLYILTSFFKRVGIKFEIHAFTVNYDLYNCPAKTIYFERKSSSIMSGYPVSIVKLLTDKMSNKDIDTVLEFVYAKLFKLPNAESPLCLAARTPTTQAIMFEIDYIPKFQAKNNIQKMHTIILTDGIPNSDTLYDSRTYEVRTLASGNYNFNFGEKYPQIYMGVASAISTYTTSTSAFVFQAMVKLFKQVVKSTLINYTIEDLKNRTKFHNSYKSTMCNGNIDKEFTNEIYSKINKNGWCEVKSIYDKHYFLDADVDESEFSYDFDESASTNSIARTMIRDSVNIRNSRMFAQSIVATLG